MITLNFDWLGLFLFVLGTALTVRAIWRGKPYRQYERKAAEPDETQVMFFQEDTDKR